MRLRTAVLCGGIFVSGCSLIYASDLDDARSGRAQSNDDAGGTSTSSSGEAGREAGSSGTSGAPVEGGTEAGQPDAGAERNGDPATGCASYHPSPQFCDDFDKDALDPSWFVHNEAGSSFLDTAKVLSPPNAVKVNLDTTKDCQYSRIERTFKLGKTLKRATFSTRLNLGFPWRNGVIPFVAAVNSQDGSQYCAALLYVYSDQDGHVQSTSINVQSDKMPNHIIGLKGYPSDNEWSEVEMTVTPSPGGAGVHWKTTFRDPDGNEETNDQDFSECPGAFTDLALYLGMHCETGKATASYDNARMDWE